MRNTSLRDMLASIVNPRSTAELSQTTTATHNKGIRRATATAQRATADNYWAMPTATLTELLTVADGPEAEAIKAVLDSRKHGNRRITAKPATPAPAPRLIYGMTPEAFAALPAEARAVLQASSASIQPTPAPTATTSNGPDTLTLPADDSVRRLYLTLLVLSQEQIAEGYGPPVPHWKLAREAQTANLQFDRPLRFELQDLEQAGLVRMIPGRKGLLWIPTVLDDQNGPDARKRSGKAERSSDIGRLVAELESSYNAAATANAPRLRRR